MHLFEQPCPAGWVYPCSLDDITRRLARLPVEDTEGLGAVGLVASTRKDHQANARYIPGELPTVKFAEAYALRHGTFCVSPLASVPRR